MIILFRLCQFLTCSTYKLYDLFKQRCYLNFDLSTCSHILFSCLWLPWSWSLCCLSVQKFYGGKPLLFLSLFISFMLSLLPFAVVRRYFRIMKRMEKMVFLIKEEHLQGIRRMRLEYELNLYSSERGQASLIISLFSSHLSTRMAFGCSGRHIRMLCFEPEPQWWCHWTVSVTRI